MGLKLILLLCFVFQLLVCEGFRRDPADGIKSHGLRKRSLAVKREENALEELSPNLPAVRRKRGLGSIIVFGTASALRLTALGISIASAATDGCALQPSICTNRNLIEKLDAEIRRNKRKFDDTYASNGKTFVDLSTASTNNAYISFYTNETVRAVETLQELTDRIVNKLSLQDFPQYSKIAAALGQNVTAEQYLNSVVGELEYSLQGVKDMITTTKNNQLIGVAIQLMVETLLNRFMNGYANAYGQIAEDLFHQSQIQNMFNENNVGDQSKITFLKKVKLMPKVFKQMGKNFVKYFKDGYKSAMKWKRIKTWKGFKGKFRASMKKPIQKISNIKNFITKKSVRNAAIRKFNLGWSQRISSVLSIVGDAVQIALTAKTWENVAKEVRKAKDNYVEYNATLSKELAKIEAETGKLDEGWDNTTATFRQVSKSIIELFSSLAKNSDFNGEFGLSSLPVDFTSQYLPANFENINKGNILSKQGIMINFLKSINHNFNQIVEDMSNRETFYSSVRDEVNTNEAVTDILKSLQNFYKRSNTDSAKTYGNSLTEKDVVCAAAVMFPLKSEYDYFQLGPFRPACESVTDADFQNMKTAAAKAKAVTEEIRGVMDTCDKWKFCPCIPMIISMTSVSTKQEAIAAMKRVSPGKTEYCGTTGCGCVPL